MARPKPHFRLHLSIASHRNTAVLWSNLQDRAIYAELGRLAIQKYAAKTNNQFNMSMAELMAVTCCRNAGAAGVRWQSFLSHCRDGAESLGGHCPVTAESLGGHWRVTFRNLAEKHNMTKNNQPKRPPKSKEVRKKKEEVRRKSEERADAPTPDWTPLERFLKGTIPIGLGGETWDTPGDWLDYHGPLIAAEAERTSGVTEGKPFWAEFKVVMHRFWNAKTPKGFLNGSKPKETKTELFDRLERESREADRERTRIS